MRLLSSGLLGLCSPFFVALAVLPIAHAADLPGSRDHPMISRYAGSEIIKYESRAFDSANLIKAKIAARGGEGKNRDSFQRVEGKLTRIAYRAPGGRSTLEVFKNYEQALTGAGFGIVFACANEDCSSRGIGRDFNEAATPRDLSVYMAFHEKDQRYLLARLKRAQGDVYAALYINRAYSLGGQNKDRVFANLVVVEAAALQTGLVKVDAAAMARGLDAEGHIALYEIYFDTDQAAVKAESDTALAEIAKLLQSQPQLQVLIVGHTDNAGAYEYNRALSERRAKAVADALAERHGIAATRLTPVGVGMAAPVASNDSEAGRGKNRRVELVKR